MACTDSSIIYVCNLFSLPNIGSILLLSKILRLDYLKKKPVLTGGIFETDAYGVPSKSQNPIILGQGSQLMSSKQFYTTYLPLPSKLPTSFMDGP